jgi:hypothetical protein
MTSSQWHPRNLVIVRAGDASLHPQWMLGSRRDFDLYVSYYGGTAGRWREGADFYEHRPGPKWPCLHALLQQQDWLREEYDAFWFPDDDLSADTDTLNRMFAFFHAHCLSLAQPALTRNSFYTWKSLLQDRDSVMRFTSFVEVMAPLFNRAALNTCWPTFCESRSGWGLDWVWPVLCRGAGEDRLAIIDATPVRHTRPVGGELYRNHGDMDPRRDAERLIRKYGLKEIRAVAQYSIDRCVRARPLPWPTRLLYWLKRLNGRRKELLWR